MQLKKDIVISAVCKLLIEKGADVKKENQKGMTALLWSTGKNRIEVSSDLIEAGADVNAATKDGVTPLFGAVGKKAFECAQLLLEQGASCESKVSDVTILHLAASENSKLVSLLLEKGKCFSFINSLDKDGDTPLHLAVMKGKSKSVSVLLSAGADPSIRNLLGKTPLDIAHIVGKKKSIEILSQAPKEKTTMEIIRELVSLVSTLTQEKIQLQTQITGLSGKLDVVMNKMKHQSREIDGLKVHLGEENLKRVCCQS